MPRTYLVFVWHMHQPFYKDLATGEYQLPWTRLHALKDYYGMVRLVEEFPGLKQTFNLVPSMLVQIADYAAGTAQDPFLRVALKPAEELTAGEREFVLRYFFQANEERMIRRYPRYGALFDAWRAGGEDAARLREEFDTQDLRDLQVLSQLAWFDEYALEEDELVRRLAEKGRGYTIEDQAGLGGKQREMVGRVVEEYRRAAARGQVELSVTPFYHPILPLVCDTEVAREAHASVALPPRFAYPEDARHQIVTALDYAERELGQRPVGLWPSEGSVSDEALKLAAEAGVRWMASDNGVLAATLGRLAGVSETYRPYRWRREGREMGLIFRDHYLSDLIGFVYSKMEPHEAAGHFVERIRENAAQMHAEGRDALVPVILDGENAWEWYEKSGRPFLRALYGRICAEPGWETVTVSEALARVEASELGHIHAGSWINANFDIWIGAEEDNQAWRLLGEARRAYDAAAGLVSDERRALAFEELLIAEGSDWCWWYGPEHHSENRAEFDKLYRDHLAQVYRALELEPPEELSRPILAARGERAEQGPCGLVQPALDGRCSSHADWLGAGVWTAERRQGAMHGRVRVLEGVRYGTDGERLLVRVEFEREPGLVARVTVSQGENERALRYELEAGSTEEAGVRTVCEQVFELAAEWGALGLRTDERVEVKISIWRDGLPVDAAPEEGSLGFVPAALGEWE